MGTLTQTVLPFKAGATEEMLTANLGEGWQRHKVTTVRWHLLYLPGKVVRHAGAWVLKVAAGAVELFRGIREKSFRLAAAIAP